MTHASGPAAPYSHRSLPLLPHALRCSCCGERIEAYDFYASGEAGPVCSECLAAGRAPCAAASQPAADPAADPAAAPGPAEAAREMSLDDLLLALRTARSDG